MDEIAITGVSCRIAKCNNLQEFKDALLQGQDLVTHGHERWNTDLLNTPSSIGIMNNLDKFDASFFGVNPRQADLLDPRTRHLIELSFECFMDAGLNPQSLRGSNTGVYVAVAENSNKVYMERALAIIANSISYYLDLKGPSFALDAGCSSSGYALNEAVEALMFGSCDQALVCGAQYHLQPFDSMEFAKLGVLSKVGKCRTFDDDRDGFVKSEGIVCVLLQRKYDAKRIYATISGIGCNVDGFKSEGLLNPSSENQLNLLRQIYSKFKINPDDVEYVDAHGTGTLVGDIKECDALAQFFATETRKETLKVGSAKTNVGHCESAAALVSLVKLLVTIHTGVIPAHIHYETMALDIAPIENGLLKVCRTQSPYGGGLLALSSFGIGGTNSHMVIRPYINSQPCSTVNRKRLVVVPSRSYDGVERWLDITEENKNNESFLTLLDHITRGSPISNYHYKGFTILNSNVRAVLKCNVSKPVWFTYSGMGSQWPKMGKDLLQLDIFRKSIEHSSSVLKRFDLDLLNIISNDDGDVFNDPEKCFPAIIGISIALTDVLLSLGIQPDGIIGHSLGEIGCAYADGVISAEEAILIAHARGLSTKQAKLIPGLMASVGITLEECEQLMPKDLHVACHNSTKNLTISGPQKSVRKFIKYLNGKGVFGKVVNTLGVAFHSEYIQSAGDIFLGKLKDILPDPKKRSRRWLPSAIAETDYDTFLGKFHSAEYQHHNFLNRVHYKQVLDKVPANAVLVEIAPRGLFQAIFSRSLSKDITSIPISSQDASDNLEFLLESVGKICTSTNVCLDLSSINEEVHSPVDARTPFISPLVEWDHSSSWFVNYYTPEVNNGKEFVLNLRSPEYKFLWGHVINGKSIFPTGGLLFLVWSAFAYKTQCKLLQCPVSLKNVKIHKRPELEDTMIFFVNILTNNYFEIVYKQEVIASGVIGSLKTSLRQIPEESANSQYLDKKDVFLEFHLRGCDYSTPFNNIEALDITGTFAKIKYNQQWIVFIESMLQCLLFKRWETTPVSFLRVKINPIAQQKLSSKGMILPYYCDKTNDVVTCGGVEIEGIDSIILNHGKSDEKPDLYHLKFVPNSVKYVGQCKDILQYSLLITLQIVHENNPSTNRTKIVELSQSQDNLKDTILGLIHKKYLRHHQYFLVQNFHEVETDTNLLVLPLDQLVPSINVLDVVENSMFILCKMEESALDQLKDHIVFKCCEGEISYVLLKKCLRIPDNFNIVEAFNNNFAWIEKVKENLSKTNSVTYLVSKTLTTGLMGFLNCLKAENQATNLRVFILNGSVDFYPTSDFYISQIRKDLTINIYTDNQWCTYRMLPLLKPKYRKKLLNYYMSISPDGVDLIESDLYYENRNVTVKYAVLNHWDARQWKQAKADGNFNRKYALEFSGTTDNGKSVMGVSFDGCLSANIDPQLSWVLPDDLNISLEEVSTIPLDYSLAYVSLIHHGQLKEHDWVLVTGTDPTCLAAAFYAIQRNSNVIIDAKSPAQIDSARDYFGGRAKLSFVDSRSDTFVSDVRRTTDDKGVNVIFTSDERDIVRSHVNVLADVGGKLVALYRDKSEIDRDILHWFTLKQCQIYRFDIKTLLGRNDGAMGLLRSTLQLYLNGNALKPFPYLSRRAMEFDDVLEYLNGESEEKMILHVDHVDCDRVERKLYLDPNKSYVVVGGLGGIGMELSKWIIQKGAKILILNARTTNLNNYQKYLVETWKSRGISITINDFPSHILEGATKLLKHASDIAPVGGIFNLAMSISNNFFQDLTPDDFLHVVSPKLHVCQNLDQLSRKMCPELDHFVVFSAAAVLGSQIVSNFGFANSSVEMLCQGREKLGLPALAVQWGWIGDVGFITKGVLKKNQIDNMQSIFSCLETLEQLMLQDNAVVSSTIYQSDNLQITGNSQNSGILSTIASIMGAKNEKDIDNDVKLVNLGIDSISSLEIKNILKDSLGVDLPTSQIRNLTLDDIKQLQLKAAGELK
ncbi:hypothetical protein GWI33_000259 [Rhynchophorus ferrugineus]|uniref:Fatty acid synthase n=1 Tax=Rhynchophorus ferrugineus TaxID=354439 RepID=A0A834IVS4_RHYFE|nr:hypothetical protein GWI33_000259 [Rhynchophorus ferrugineus]